MQSLERRVAALEAKKPNDPFMAFRMLAGENEAEARLRCGVAEDAINVLFIQRVIVEVPHAKY